MKKYIIRYGAMRTHSVVKVEDASADGFFHGVEIVVRTSRGLELATILCEATDDRIAKLPSRNKDADAVFVRRASGADLAKSAAMKRLERDDFERCDRIVERMKIVMKLVRIERILGGEKLVVYYVADGRVDFRELVRALAAEFQTRIEMKQIGARDEMKLLADVGDCGREVCCNAFMTEMQSVTMKMTKLQKATLDPTKISGRCGKLKCCLRYEYEVYNELRNETPAIGRVVATPHGNGRVIAQELLAQRVTVEFPSGETCSFSLEELR